MTWRDTIDSIVIPSPNAPWWYDVALPCGCALVGLVLIGVCMVMWSLIR
jgi:hypothetical protein